MARFIAEVSSNHGRDPQRCIDFIDAAAEIGCWAVKFQLFRIDHMFAPEILAVSPMHRARRDWELPVDYLPRLAQRCRERGIRFACTPFDLQAVEELAPHVDFYKIASYELLWHPLLSACAATGKPLILSTGMAVDAEIDAAVQAARLAGAQDLTLLHCVSGYPTPAPDCNLAAIASLRERHGCGTGWSDHSVDAAVVCRAVHRWGAEVVEFHLDLDGRGEEYASGHCWLPETVAPVIRACHDAREADGDGRKLPAAAERPDCDWRADPVDGLRPLQPVRPEKAAELKERYRESS